MSCLPEPHHANHQGSQAIGQLYPPRGDRAAALRKDQEAATFTHRSAIVNWPNPMPFISAAADACPKPFPDGGHLPRAV
jgi:hypothetical protein